MPRQKTKEELEDRIDELEAENETLQDQIDSIQEIIGPERTTTRGTLAPACGAGWRKEVHEITDRRLRQRAVECRPTDHVNSCVNWYLGSPFIDMAACPLGQSRYCGFRHATETGLPPD